MSEAGSEAIARLRSPLTIRERCGNVLAAGLRGELRHFGVHLEHMPAAVELTWQVMRENYPALDIPVHGRVNHFKVGGIDRTSRLEAGISDVRERARALSDLIVTSVLLDAGAGPDWVYTEPGTGLVTRRSEGLALASYHCFSQGLFSSQADEPLRADAAGLAAVTAESLARGFQVSASNPLLGLEGRAELLGRLGRAISSRPEQFGGQGRVGGLCDVLIADSVRGRLPAARILARVLEALGPIWPARTQLFGVDLGDVWPHPSAQGEGSSRGLVPLHKLSQWLSYSLIHPLEIAGVQVSDVDELTGLAEYRNGGLFIDTGVLSAKHAGVTSEVHAAGAEVIVEWRALTVALLDQLAADLRAKAGLDRDALPLGKVLEGGTWAAGRRLAAERRGGAPPISVRSDGTLF